MIQIEEKEGKRGIRSQKKGTLERKKKHFMTKQFETIKKLNGFSLAFSGRIGKWLAIVTTNSFHLPM